jgi:hypothetical protein
MIITNPEFQPFFIAMENLCNPKTQIVLLLDPKSYLANSASQKLHKDLDFFLVNRSDLPADGTIPSSKQHVIFRIMSGMDNYFLEFLKGEVFLTSFDVQNNPVEVTSPDVVAAYKQHGLYFLTTAKNKQGLGLSMKRAAISFVGVTPTLADMSSQGSSHYLHRKIVASNAHSKEYAVQNNNNMYGPDFNDLLGLSP